MGSSDSKIESNGTVVIRHPNSGIEVVNKGKGYTITNSLKSTMGAHEIEADAMMRELQLACTTVTALGAQHVIKSCSPYETMVKK